MSCFWMLCVVLLSVLIIHCMYSGLESYRNSSDESYQYGHETVTGKDGVCSSDGLHSAKCDIYAFGTHSNFNDTLHVHDDIYVCKNHCNTETVHEAVKDQNNVPLTGKTDSKFYKISDVINNNYTTGLNGSIAERIIHGLSARRNTLKEKQIQATHNISKLEESRKNFKTHIKTHAKDLYDDYCDGTPFDSEHNDNDVDKNFVAPSGMSRRNDICHRLKMLQLQ